MFWTETAILLHVGTKDALLPDKDLTAVFSACCFHQKGTALPKQHPCCLGKRRRKSETKKGFPGSSLRKYAQGYDDRENVTTRRSICGHWAKFVIEGQPNRTASKKGRRGPTCTVCVLHNAVWAEWI